MADISTRLTRNPRLRIWAILGVLLLASVGFLAIGLGRRGGETASPGDLRLRILDASGEPVTDAEVYVEQPEETAAAPLGRWSRKSGTLTLPAPPSEGHTVYVQARGYRSQRLVGLTQGGDLLLRRGFAARLNVEGDTLPSDDPLRLVFRVRPAPDEKAGVSEDELDKLVDLMDLVSPPAADEPDLPRRTFGFAVADTVAARGILLPVAGQYLVRWGLFDAAAETWFSLGAEAEAHIGVEDDPRPQIFDVPVTRNALDRTRIGLAKRIDERKKP